MPGAGTSPRRLLIAGATGLTGAHLLRVVLEAPGVEQIVAPTRQPLPPHPRLQNPVGPLAELLPRIEGPFDAVFICLGTTMKQAGSKKAFRAVDFDLVVATAKRAREIGTPTCVVVSAVGAHPQSLIFYSRVKGETERSLKSLGFPSLVIARPSLIIGERREMRLGERLAAPFARLLPGKYGGIEAAALARALWRLGCEGPAGVRIVESDELRDLGRVPFEV